MRSPQAVSRPCGEPPNGEQHSAASSTAMQNGPASLDQLDNGEPHKRRLFNFNADRSRIPGPDSQRRAAQASPLLLHRRPVPHHRTSSPGVVFLRSHKLFVDPVESSCHLRRRASCTAQRFGGLLYLRDRRREVGLKIWPPRPAPASPTLSLRGSCGDRHYMYIVRSLFVAIPVICC